MNCRGMIVAILCLSLIGSVAAQKSQDKESTVPSAPGTDNPAYVIGPEDVLSVNVWKEAEVSGSVPVRPDGKISLPLLNDVQAAGLTPTQLAADITEKLKKYVEQPRVTVVVTAINSRRVYIMGQVARPGAFPLLPGMTVLQALSSAGGLAEFAHSKDIYVLRTENGKQQKLPFNYKAVLKAQNGAQDIPLKAGDTIIVP